MAVNVTSSPTFIRDQVKGWYTRLIFSQTFMEVLTISDFNYFTTVSTSNCKGSGTLPANYWSDGRILRVRGTFLYSGNGTQLNIKCGIEDANGVKIFAYQDNNNNHDFASLENHSDVPVSFEFNIMHSYENNFTVEGYYKYEFGSYDAGGVNTKVVYVPITPAAGNTIDTTIGTQILFYISPNSVNMIYVTVEELG